MSQIVEQLENTIEQVVEPVVEPVKNPVKKKPVKKNAVIDGFKKCKGCEKSLEVCEFYETKNTKKKSWQSKCKKCHNSYKTLKVDNRIRQSGFPRYPEEKQKAIRDDIKSGMMLSTLCKKYKINYESMKSRKYKRMPPFE